ncbi:MAG TPA: hypothetical protein VLA88_03295 [Candidatus Saccharimonadales bacterium]|nr:hypothetical protein [Candidatus Saccharimonadales bacterium]
MRRSRVLAVLTAVVLTVSMAACGESSGNKGSAVSVPVAKVNAPAGEMPQTLPVSFLWPQNAGQMPENLKVNFGIMAKFTKGNLTHPMPKLVRVDDAVTCLTNFGSTSLQVGDKATANEGFNAFHACRLNGELVIAYGPKKMFQDHKDSIATDETGDFWYGSLASLYRNYLVELHNRKSPTDYTCLYGLVLGGLRDAKYVPESVATIEETLATAAQKTAFNKGRDEGSC